MAVDPFSIAFGLTGIATSLFGAGAEAEALRQQGEYQARIYEFNAKLQDIFSADAIRRGDADAAAVMREARQVRGAQRASFAAQGVEVDAGSAYDVQAETDYHAKLDALEVKNNAWREAWGYKVQKLDLEMRADLARKGGQAAADASWLSGGLKAFGYGAGVAAEIGRGATTRTPKDDTRIGRRNTVTTYGFGGRRNR